MKKIISAILLSVTLLSLASCKLGLDGFDVDAGGDGVDIYGVVTTVHDQHHTCLFFPSTGHIVMPRVKGGKPIPEYGIGDLVKISFDTAIENIPIMESFPGQFGIEAESVSVKSDDVSYSLTEEGVYFSDKLPEGSDFKVGDDLIFSVRAEGEKKEIASATVTAIGDGKYTVLLESYGTGAEFFKFIYEYELNISKK